MDACDEFRAEVHCKIDAFHLLEDAKLLLLCEEQELFGHYCWLCVLHLNERNRGYATCTDQASKDAIRQKCKAALAPIERDLRAVLRPYMTSVVRDPHEELLLALEACLQSRERLAAWERDMRGGLQQAEDVIL
jgi:hypothetical protein